MLSGILIWPILSRRYQNRKKRKLEKKRQEKDSAYIKNMRNGESYIGVIFKDSMNIGIISMENIPKVFKSDGKIFIAVPDRSMYAIDAATGKEVMEQPQSAREAIGLSRDGKTVYTKSMWHKLFAFNASDASLKWSAETGAGYEIGPTPIVETSRGVLYPTDKGNLLSFSSEDGSLLWAHKISIALVNPLYVVSDTSGGCKVLASTMDGVITLLQF